MKSKMYKKNRYLPRPGKCPKFLKFLPPRFGLHFYIVDLIHKNPNIYIYLEIEINFFDLAIFIDNASYKLYLHLPAFTKAI